MNPACGDCFGFQITVRCTTLNLTRCIHMHKQCTSTLETHCFVCVCSAPPVETDLLLMSKLLLKVKHGTKRPLQKRPLPLGVNKHRDRHRQGVTTSPRGSNTRKPYHAHRQQHQQEATHPQTATRPQDDILKQIEFQQRPCISGAPTGKNIDNLTSPICIVSRVVLL